MHLFSSFLLLFLLSLGSLLEGALFTIVPPPLQKAVNALYSFPETKAFLTSLEKEGPITLHYESLGPNAFNALWYGKERVIVLNASKQLNEGKKISSLLFELHNAKANKALAACDKLAWTNKISKSHYVESIERIEYQNVLSTSTLIQTAISQNYFPYEAYFPVHGSFYEHYELQIRMGHSAFIAKRYDNLAATPLNPS